jgi:hypothetical protein
MPELLVSHLTLSLFFFCCIAVMVCDTPLLVPSKSGGGRTPARHVASGLRFGHRHRSPRRLGSLRRVSFNSPSVLDYMKILALISLSSQDAPKRTNAHAGAGEIPLSHGTKGCCTGGGDNIGGS